MNENFSHTSTQYYNTKAWSEEGHLRHNSWRQSPPPPAWRATSPTYLRLQAAWSGLPTNIFILFRCIGCTPLYCCVDRKKMSMTAFWIWNSRIQSRVIDKLNSCFVLFTKIVKYKIVVQYSMLWLLDYPYLWCCERYPFFSTKLFGWFFLYVQKNN